MKFSAIDIPLLLALGISGFMGYRGGPARKLFNLLMLLLSVVVAAKLMEPIGLYLAETGIMSEVASYVAAFALVLVAIMVPAILLYRRFGKSGMGRPTMNAIGIVLGVIEGAFITSFVLFSLRVFDFPDQETRDESLLYRPLANFMPKTLEMLQSYFPGASSFREELSRHFKNPDPR